MARHPKKGQRSEYAQRAGQPQKYTKKGATPTPYNQQVSGGKKDVKRGGVGNNGPVRSSPLSRRMEFDTSQIIPLFRTTLNPHQEAAWEMMGKRRISLLLGPAGTAKTHCAIARAMHELIVTRSVGRVVLVRPAVEAGEKLGFLPGDLTAKLDPYFRPVYDILDDLIGWQGALREQVDQCQEIAAVAFMRGRTFKDSVIILDEAQNCTRQQLKMVMTRIGKGSKIIVTGDPDQSDLPHSEQNPLARLCENIARKKLTERSIIGTYLFPRTAIVRDEAVVEALSAFDDGMDDYGQPVKNNKAA